MIKIKRKQIPLCRECHMVKHKTNEIKKNLRWRIQGNK
jgi:hypothetical protein